MKNLKRKVITGTCVLSMCIMSTSVFASEKLENAKQVKVSDSIKIESQANIQPRERFEYILQVKRRTALRDAETNQIIRYLEPTEYLLSHQNPGLYPYNSILVYWVDGTVAGRVMASDVDWH